MAYSYDQHRPVWVESARMDLDDQAEALLSCAPTVPATLDDQPDHPWLGSVAAASQAPRIPRDRPIIGTSQQGRVIHREGDKMPPTDPILDLEDLGHSLVLWISAPVLLAIVVALVAGVKWVDVVEFLALIGGAS